MAASLKGRKNKSVETVEETKSTKSVEISRMRKVGFDNNPSLKAFFSATVTGYPVATRVTFTEKESSGDSDEINPDDYNILFQSRKGNDGNRYDYLHPIDGDTRKDVKMNVLKAFKKFFEDEKDIFIDENDIAVSQVTERNNFKGQLGDALVLTTRTMALHNLELHQSRDGNYDLAYPGRNYKNDKGEWNKIPFYWPQKDSDTTQAILEMAVKEYEKA